MAVKNGLLEVIADDAEVPTKAKDSDDAVTRITDDESQMILDSQLL